MALKNNIFLYGQHKILEMRHTGKGTNVTPQKSCE